MDILGKILGILSLVLAILSTPAALISGIGVGGALISLALAGMAAALLSIKLTIISVVINTVNIFGFSVITLTNDILDIQMQVILGIPYLLFLLGLGIGVYRNKCDASGNDL